SVSMARALRMSTIWYIVSGYQIVGIMPMNAAQPLNDVVPVVTRILPRESNRLWTMERFGGDRVTAGNSNSSVSSSGPTSEKTRAGTWAPTKARMLLMEFANQVRCGV